MADRFSTRKLFEALDDRRFEDYPSFRKAVFELFWEHVSDFPPHYSHDDAISWARRHDWLVVEDGGLRVRVKDPERSAA